MPPRRSIAFMGALLVAAAVLIPVRASAAPEWLDRVNFNRALAGEAPVGEDTGLEPGAINHSRYIVENGGLSHHEDPGNPWYTSAGDQAGSHGDVALETGGVYSQQGAIDGWMTAPFHALSILSPRATGFGYGQFDRGGVLSAATLDTGSDANSIPLPSTPVVWPANGATVPYLTYSGSETPNPETFCPPRDCAGLPLVAITSAWNSVSSWSLRDEAGHDLEAYELDGTNTGADPTAQAVLRGYGGVILFPRAPLGPGHTYTASLVVAGSTVSWAFSTNPSNRTLGPTGYTVVASNGGIYPFGRAQGHGGLADQHLNAPVIATAGTPDGQGYWMVAGDGGMFPFGTARGFGSTGGEHLNQPVVGMSSTPDAGGYWLVASDGGIFPFGNAGGYGSHGGSPLNQPIVGMAATGSGNGYWLVAADGGIFPYGDATGLGSHGGSPLNQPIVGMATTATGLGYWLVARDGGVFPYGDALSHSYGSTGGIHLNQPIVGMTRTASGNGYFLIAADGGIFPFGDAVGIGSTGDQTLPGAGVGLLPAV